ncbi:MAG: SAM-dependent methyltransferase [Thermodesulfovibrio sp.]|nr:SAM-dependent methyltransferase [Thermodesulfovibrio sp.]
MNNLLASINNYYSAKIERHGPTPNGVDWRNEESQLLRFEQVLKIIDDDREFGLNDVGCGYGKLFDFMKKNISNKFLYCGYDLSGAMIEQAKSLYQNNDNCSFIQVKDQSAFAVADYTVASGIFNVKQDCADEEWREYIIETLLRMNSASKRGMAFNCLTSYSDRHLMRADLYYADPCGFFDFCKKNLSKKVTLLHDYDLYEFTILVKKD